jgi:hypothetical protein
LILITGAAPPLEAIGAVAPTPITVPELELGVYASQAVPPELIRTDCPAEGVTVVYVSSTFATGIDSAGIVVKFKPPLFTGRVADKPAAVPVVF